ncbi:MAG TPA: ABC-F family ATP-binding cassette domain-containing protein [Gaiellaceae bacterium]|jgi:ATPase subunit of ABC transporter with duplicated ATPase domains|nr:ABC-F family ATP-binding cassette domain-containing protein [Gaiellaceae bacterium]
MRVQLAGVGKHHGAQLVLENVSLPIGPRARIGLVGPNGVGKSTLLRIAAGLEQPDSGDVTRAPASLTVGYLEQERSLGGDESVLAHLARQVGVAGAERELEEAAAQLARSETAAERYATALERVVALGAYDFEARARATCSELGLGIELERAPTGLSGGERARVALASILLSRFDVLLLDEPTNDLDFDGLDRLERFLASYRGALVVVSHDRELLDRTVDQIAAIEPDTRRLRLWAGGWSAYVAAREAERTAALETYERAQTRRRHLAELVSTRRSEARASGASLGDKTGGQDRRATHALATKVRQAQRLLERNELPEKPYQPWELRLSLAAAPRAGDQVLRLSGAVAERGSFRLGPVDLDVAPGERLSIVGRNGTGKSTLAGMITGDVPLAAGRRVVGGRTVIGRIGQERDAYGVADPLLDRFRARTELPVSEARTLLAKFGLGADHVDRSCVLLSPGERTRAHLAELQARGVNLLVLDEPTNHLDLEAVEQLESALAGYDGTLVVVSHDRRFLERIEPTRRLGLPL